MTKNRQARRRERAKKKRNPNGTAAAQLASLPQARKLSQSPGRRAANELDGFAYTRDRLFELAQMQGDWAGIPMPIDGERLVIEPSYPWAEALGCQIGVPDGHDPEADAAYAGWSIVNKFYSDRRRADILVLRKPNGRITWGAEPAFHHIAMDLHTLGCSDAWGLDQEQRALRLLGDLISHRQMKHYVLTGMFLEKSKRSGVTYVFRRLKPTVACAGTDPKKSMRILCCLCMHPIAYYAGSWAGAMCPTDDVIAHLQLMRADEHMFWKRSNQHPPYRPEAGL